MTWSKEGETAFRKPRKVDIKNITYHLYGEEAAIRKINPKEEEDLVRMFQIEWSEGMVKRIAKPNDIILTPEDMIKWIRRKSGRTRKGQSFLTQLFAVTKNDPKIMGDWKTRSQDIEGWIRVDGSSPNSKDQSEERDRFERIMKATLTDQPLPVELTYIKRPNGPRHLMASAVRTTCHLIAAQDGEVNGDFFYEKDGKLYPKRIVMAFVDNEWSEEGEDIVSKKVLEEAGFDLVKKRVTWGEKDITADKDMYVLNWERFHKIMEEKNKIAEDELLKRIDKLIPITSV